MKCKSCGIEMTRERLDGNTAVYKCRNTQCPEHGKEQKHELPENR